MLMSKWSLSSGNPISSQNRLFDVSAFKIAAALWKPKLLYQFKKQNNHLALDDIREAISEMGFYRQHLLAELNTK